MTNHYKIFTNYIDDLIIDYADKDKNGYHLTFQSLSDFQMGKLVNLYLEYQNREISSNCFFNDDVTSAFLNLLRDDSKYNREAFALLVRDNSIKEYMGVIQEYINERCIDVERECKAEEGFYQKQDKNSGEMYWSKT